jgi:hypothetical protein
MKPFTYPPLVQFRNGVNVPTSRDEEMANRDAVCSSFESEAHQHACNQVAQMYGLENIDEFVSAAPDLLCEPIGKKKKLKKWKIFIFIFNVTISLFLF